MADPRFIPATPDSTPLITYNPPLDPSSERVISLRQVSTIAFGDNGSVQVTTPVSVETLYFSDQAAYLAFHDQALKLWSSLKG